MINCDVEGETEINPFLPKLLLIMVSITAIEAQLRHIVRDLVLVVGDLDFCCGGLKENGTHRPIESGTIRRCGLVGGSVSLGVGFEVSDNQAAPSDLPADQEQNSQCLLQHHIRLFPAMMMVGTSEL